MTKTKPIPVIDLGDGMTFALHSFKTKEGEVILGFLFKPGHNKPATFFSLDKIAKLNNGIVGNVQQFQKLYKDGEEAIAKGWTVEFGEVKAEVPDEETNSNDGLINFNTTTKTKPAEPAESTSEPNDKLKSAQDILDNMGF